MCFDILDCLVFHNFKKENRQNRLLKSFFREHKLSRIGLFRIFKSRNFCKKGQNSRKSRKFLLAKACTLKVFILNDEEPGSDEKHEIRTHVFLAWPVSFPTDLSNLHFTNKIVPSYLFKEFIYLDDIIKLLQTITLKST